MNSYIKSLFITSPALSNTLFIFFCGTRKWLNLGCAIMPKGARLFHQNSLKEYHFLFDLWQTFLSKMNSLCSCGPVSEFFLHFYGSILFMDLWSPFPHYFNYWTFSNSESTYQVSPLFCPFIKLVWLMYNFHIAI